MTAKEYLSQAFLLDKSTNCKLEQVRSLHELATKATSTLSDVPPSGTRNVHRMEDVIVKILDLESEINDDINALVDLKCEIVKAIKRVDSAEYRTLLELRYLCFKSWSDIAVEMNYSQDHIFTVHRKALSKIILTVKSVEKQ
ncbi:hypothetical protein FACS1894133_4530 [Clostridia bacterium]|nr:hypothetical protein FACS1894133_4530 [Clostridia bacterium]